VNAVTAERGIQAAMFALVIVGLYALTGWALFNFVEDLILKVGGIALCWGVILLALYVAFKKLNWTWWS
jgi:hypothetical protein